MGAFELLHRVGEETGWNVNSMLHIACEYIDKQQDESAFEDFVHAQAELEQSNLLEPTVEETDDNDEET